MTATLLLLLASFVFLLIGDDRVTQWLQVSAFPTAILAVGSYAATDLRGQK